MIVLTIQEMKSEKQRNILYIYIHSIKNRADSCCERQYNSQRWQSILSLCLQRYPSPNANEFNTPMPTFYKVFSGLNKEGRRNLGNYECTSGPNGLLCQSSMDRMCLLIHRCNVTSASLFSLLHLIMFYGLFVNL